MALADREKWNRLTEDLNLVGGWLCLAFANTADWHASEKPVEYLNSFADLVFWARAAERLTEEDEIRLLPFANEQPAVAARVLAQAIELREVIYRIFTAIAMERPVAESDLVGLNAVLHKALAHQIILPARDGFVWGWRALGAPGDDAPDRMLWPVVRSAADLLVHGQLERVGLCADENGCGYLFYDTSRNRTRRWCDMKGCGNRAKARRHYQRGRQDGKVTVTPSSP